MIKSVRVFATIALAVSLLAASPALAQRPHQASAERPVLLIDQIISGQLEKGGEKELQPLDTMAEIEDYLIAKKVRYGQNRVLLDVRTADAKLVKAIADLPPGEIFVIPQDGALMFNQVRALTPEEAELIVIQAQ